MRSYLTLLLLLVASHAAADSAWHKVAFRKWDGCYEAQAGGVRVVVVPAAGGRIAWYGTPERNLLLEDPKVDGTLLPAGQEWMPWDGCQTDLIDDADRRQFGPVWLGRYEVVSAGGKALVLRSVVHPGNGVQVTKRYELDARLPGLRYTVTAANRSGKPAGWCIWERALFAPPGEAALPFRTDGPLKGLAQEKVPAGALEAQAGQAIVRPVGEGASVASDSPAGWVRWQAGRQGVEISFAGRPGADYRAGKRCILFFAANRVELEPLSPRAELAPGQAVTLRETWRLRTREDGDGQPEGTAPGR